jgi:hypothetical protein
MRLEDSFDPDDFFSLMDGAIFQIKSREDAMANLANMEVWQVEEVADETLEGRPVTLISKIAPEKAAKLDHNSVLYRNNEIIIATEKAMKDAENALNAEAFIGDRVLKCVTDEQFIRLQHIHWLAIGILLKPKQEEQKPEESNVTPNQTQRDVSVKRLDKAEAFTKDRAIERVASNVQRDLSNITKKVVEEAREKQDDLNKVEKRDREKTTQLKSKEDSRTKSTDDAKSHAKSEELTKKAQGLEGPPINEIFGSMSEPEKLKENLGGPNPNA